MLEEPNGPPHEPLRDPPAQPENDPPDRPLRDPDGDPTYEPPQRPLGEPTPNPGHDQPLEMPGDPRIPAGKNNKSKTELLQARSAIIEKSQLSTNVDSRYCDADVSREMVTKPRTIPKGDVDKLLESQRVEDTRKALNQMTHVEIERGHSNRRRS